VEQLIVVNYDLQINYVKYSITSREKDLNAM